MLPPEVVQILTADMRGLHDSILFIEKELLKSKSPTYPLFPVRVPLGVGFVDKYPAELFFLRFDDLFNVYNLRRLDPTVVRLVALKMAHIMMEESTRASRWTPSTCFRAPWLTHGTGCLPRSISSNS